MLVIMSLHTLHTTYSFYYGHCTSTSQEDITSIVLSQCEAAHKITFYSKIKILVHISQVQSVDDREIINTATSFANIISPHMMEFTQ